MGARICVCVATYNGAEYISDQLFSILKQLGPNDLVILSDDASSDETLTRVRQINDPRIHILAHTDNVGYVGNFERALLRTQTEPNIGYVFLSDQDDIWVDGKVDLVVGRLSSEASTAFLCHSVRMVDERLVPTGTCLEALEYDGKFLLKSFIRPQAFGCGMAFRRPLLDKILPFPKYVTYTHDHWIELCGVAHKTALKEVTPLVLYRRHVQALTEMEIDAKMKKRVASFGNIVKYRLQYLALIVSALTRAWMR